MPPRGHGAGGGVRGGGAGAAGGGGEGGKRLAERRGMGTAAAAAAVAAAAGDAEGARARRCSSLTWPAAVRLRPAPAHQRRAAGARPVARLQRGLHRRPRALHPALHRAVPRKGHRLPRRQAGCGAALGGGALWRRAGGGAAGGGRLEEARQGAALRAAAGLFGPAGSLARHAGAPARPAPPRALRPLPPPRPSHYAPRQLPVQVVGRGLPPQGDRFWALHPPRRR
jgi:hypothetical protein